MKKISACLLFLTALAALSCQGSKETVDLKIGTAVIRAEVAANDAERATGLMNRDSLPENYGMIFAYDQDQHMTFWMKNTRIPLSIAFISRDGTIREIKDMEAYSLKTIESANAVRYAIEVPKGLFGKLGIKPGDRVEIPRAVDERVKAGK